MLRVAFAGTFAARLEPQVRAHLDVPCDVVVADEAAIAAPTLPAHHAFHELPNVLMTPHVSGWTEGMLEARAKVIAENVGRAARGEPPVNLIPALG
jgi:lactate dehydrogenase-like 2-hydroxyacid dehydrogenase